LRGENGKWICVFSKRLQVSSAYVAELCIVFEGLDLAGFHKIEFHFDSLVVLRFQIVNEGLWQVGV